MAVNQDQQYAILDPEWDESTLEICPICDIFQRDEEDMNCIECGYVFYNRDQS